MFDNKTKLAILLDKTQITLNVPIFSLIDDPDYVLPTPAEGIVIVAPPVQKVKVFNEAMIDAALAILEIFDKGLKPGSVNTFNVNIDIIKSSLEYVPGKAVFNVNASYDNSKTVLELCLDNHDKLYDFINLEEVSGIKHLIGALANHVYSRADVPQVFKDSFDVIFELTHRGNDIIEFAMSGSTFNYKGIFIHENIVVLDSPGFDKLVSFTDIPISAKFTIQEACSNLETLKTSKSAAALEFLRNHL